MPSFTLSAHTPAPVEEVWKLLHDPRRFPEWWEGMASVETPVGAPASTEDSVTGYTMWLEGYPDFPMGQELSTGPGVVTISCLVSDLEYTWRLAEVAPPAVGTDISVLVVIPEVEAHRLETQHVVLSRSLGRLAQLASLS
jgi:uncharacterized protein YndB with AHSA1/START domain